MLVKLYICHLTPHFFNRNRSIRAVHLSLKVLPVSKQTITEVFFPAVRPSLKPDNGLNMTSWIWEMRKVIGDRRILVWMWKDVIMWEAIFLYRSPNASVQSRSCWPVLKDSISNPPDNTVGVHSALFSHEPSHPSPSCPRGPILQWEEVLILPWGNCSVGDLFLQPVECIWKYGGCVSYN